METEKYYFRVGVFFIIVAGLFVYYLITFGGGQTMRDLTRYVVYFDHSVAGLTRGAPVRMNGLDVGLVDSTRFVDHGSDRILVLVDIDSNAPVREDTVASIAFQGITGTSYLALENQKIGQKAAPLEKKTGETYPVIASRQSELQLVMANAPTVMEKLVRMAGQMEKLLSDENISGVQSVIVNANGAVTEATGAMREFKMLARTLRDDPSIILRGSKYEGYKVNEQVNE